jgi:hypothetical protein
MEPLADRLPGSAPLDGAHQPPWAGTEKQVPTPVLSRVASERLGPTVAAIERCPGDSDEITEEKKMKINMQVERNATGKALPVRTLKAGATRAGLEKGSRK